MNKTGVRAIILVPICVTFALSAAWGQDFENPSSWAAFDAGANGVGTDPDGYARAVYDGRYVYFAPVDNGTERHGEVLRYDTLGSFSTSSSWATYDPGANGVGVDPDGYTDAVFDGRYIYFAPHLNGPDYHGEVLRYDTLSTFSSASSWLTFDPSANGVGFEPRGYQGTVFDGRYIYFSPGTRNSGTHGEVLRYDTTGGFSNTSSWEAFDPGANGVGTDPVGYRGAVYDGRYVYFVPFFSSTSGHHGEVLRYDTLGGFSLTASWATFDAGANGVGTNPVGYIGGIFDGRFVYFVPTETANLVGHGEVLRYDTAGSFSSTSAWATFDPGANGVGTDPDGYEGGVFDGRYVYFAPLHNGTNYHGEVLRYDASGLFADTASWDTFDASSNGVGIDATGYIGATFDGQYVYFSPFFNSTGHHGKVLRYDASGTTEGCLYRDLFEAEWVLLAGDIGINLNDVASPGKRIPERFGIAMVREVLCRFGHSRHDATSSEYLLNLNALEIEAAPIASQVDPYKHALAAVLLINQARQDYFKTVFGLLNSYSVVNVPGGKASGGEIFSDDGDLDDDGYSNASEYDLIIASGGSVDDFAMAATTPGNPALPLLSMIGLLVSAFLLASGGCLFLATRISSL